MWRRRSHSLRGMRRSRSLHASCLLATLLLGVSRVGVDGARLDDLEEALELDEESLALENEGKELGRAEVGQRRVSISASSFAEERPQTAKSSSSSAAEQDKSAPAADIKESEVRGDADDANASTSIAGTDGADSANGSTSNASAKGSDGADGSVSITSAEGSDSTSSSSSSSSSSSIARAAVSDGSTGADGADSTVASAEGATIGSDGANSSASIANAAVTDGSTGADGANSTVASAEGATMGAGGGEDTTVAPLEQKFSRERHRTRILMIGCFLLVVVLAVLVGMC